MSRFLNWLHAMDGKSSTGKALHPYVGQSGRRRRLADRQIRLGPVYPIKRLESKANLQQDFGFEAIGD